MSGQTSALTYITNNGDLYIGPDENSDLLTITATADNDYSESTTRTLKGALIVPIGGAIIVQKDADNDGLEEVTPVKPNFNANVITIPTVSGVLYKDGVTALTNGQKITVVNGTPKTITAEARAGKELTTGATASWVFTYAA